MKRMKFILFAIGLIAGIGTSTAAMSTSQIRKETRFLTDKMAYELNFSTAQYNDAYEINYDFIYSVRYLMDDVLKGNERASDKYYDNLDIRNDDLRWIMNDKQYRRFLSTDYFYRPIYTSGGKWQFRIYVTYSNRSLFYFGKPYNYSSYRGGHYRTSQNSVSYYKGRHKVSPYHGEYSVKPNKVTNRRSDFGPSRVSTGNNKNKESDRGKETNKNNVENKNKETNKNSVDNRRDSKNTTTTTTTTKRSETQSSRRTNSTSTQKSPETSRSQSGSSRRQ